MPDLPLDTLVIFGLILASLIGRIFQKKENPDSGESTPQDVPTTEGASLEDILRKAWPGQEETEEEVWEEEVPLQFQEPEQMVVPAMVSKQQPSPVTAEGPSKPENAKDNDKKANWLIEELGSSKGSLRRAFVIKEVLDKPVSLRSTPYS
jgi:hypothetical protein